MKALVNKEPCIVYASVTSVTESCKITCIVRIVLHIALQPTSTGSYTYEFFSKDGIIYECLVAKKSS